MPLIIIHAKQESRKLTGDTIAEENAFDYNDNHSCCNNTNGGKYARKINNQKTWDD